MKLKLILYNDYKVIKIVSFIVFFLMFLLLRLGLTIEFDTFDSKNKLNFVWLEKN